METHIVNEDKRWMNKCVDHDIVEETFTWNKKMCYY